MSHVEPEHRGLWARLTAQLPVKIAVWLGLAVGICIPYFTLQQVELFALRTVPATPIDDWVPFVPGFIWVYLSIAALVPLAPLLAETRTELRRYSWGLFLLCLPCFVTFALFPVDGPRPPIAPDHPLYRWLVSVDRPSNSMPSLHAGLTVYSLLCAHRVLRGELSRIVRTALLSFWVAWGALIFYATLATKQHWFVDLPAGALLAYCAYALAWRGKVMPDRGLKHRG